MNKFSFVHILLFATAICFFLPPIATRGGHSDYIRPGDGNSSFHGTARSLFAQVEPRPSAELAPGYMTNDDLEKAMKDFTKRCSKISRLYSIGKSVNGFPLWVIEISDRPGEIEAELAFKVEYYFSDENLPTDKFLLNAMKKNIKGFVPISTIATFHKMKKLTRDHALIVSALKESSFLVVSRDGKKVKVGLVYPYWKELHLYTKEFLQQS